MTGGDQTLVSAQATQWESKGGNGGSHFLEGETEVHRRGRYPTLTPGCLAPPWASWKRVWTAHRGGVGCIRVVLQHPGEPEIGHLADQVAVNQDIAGGQVAVDVAQVREVAHAGAHASEHAYQLRDGELPIMSLQGTWPGFRKALSCL